MRARAGSSGRGCGGSRMQGGIYIECGLVPGHNALPLDFFIMDPPRPWPDIHASVGVDLVEFDGVTHVFDVVGSDSYPTPADILEEIRVKGASRKVAPGLDFSKLTTRSRLILLHRKAVITNLEDVAPWELLNPNFAQVDGCKCSHWIKSGRPEVAGRIGREHISDFTIPCVAYHWMLHPPHGDDSKTRMVGDLTYPVWYPQKGYRVAPEYQVGIIASLPITGISVIRSEDGSHEVTLRHIKGQTDIWTREEPE